MTWLRTQVLQVWATDARYVEAQLTSVCRTAARKPGVAVRRGATLL